MLIANFLGYKHWSSCWAYIIINLAKHYEEEKHE